MSNIDNRIQHRAMVALNAILNIPFDLTDDISDSRNDMILVLQGIVNYKPIDDDYSEICLNITEMFEMFDSLTPTVH